MKKTKKDRPIRWLIFIAIMSTLMAFKVGRDNSLTKVKQQQHDWNRKALVYMNMLQFEIQCVQHEKAAELRDDGEKLESVISDKGVDENGHWYRGWCYDAEVYSSEYQNLRREYINKYGRDDFDAWEFQLSNPNLHL